jgi:hypothetical protein
MEILQENGTAGVDRAVSDAYIRKARGLRVLLSDGMAAKSKLSRLFTAGNRAYR